MVIVVIRKLKRRFVFVNMSILTCLMLGIQIAVFTMMYRSEVRVSEQIMDHVAQSHMDKGRGEKPPEPPGDSPSASMPAGSIQLGYHGQEQTSSALTYEEAQLEDPSGQGWDGAQPEENQGQWNDQRHFDRYGAWHPWPQYPDRPYDPWGPWGPPPEEPQVTEPAVTDVPLPTETTAAPVQTQAETEPETEPPVQTREQPVIVTQTPEPVPEPTPATEAPVADTTETAPPETTAVPETTRRTMASMATAEPVDKKMGMYMRNSVYVSLSSSNVIESAMSQFGVENDMDTVSLAVSQVLESGKERGTIKVGDIHYRYCKTQPGPDHSYGVVLLDRSVELSTLSRLLVIFVIIGVVGLMLIFVISVALANWTIRPIEQAWEKQKQFVADASHELKTPLAVISANTDVVLSNPNDLVHNQEKFLNYIKDETVRMTRLVGNLLFIAKSDAKQLKSAPQSFDMSDLVSSVCLVFEPLAFEQEKTLETSIQAHISYVGDQDRIKQLLTILLDNALLHSTEHAHIQVSLSQDCQQKIRLAVSNSAQDIPPDKLEKLFDRFYRLDESRAKRTGGSGLGLNIAQTIVQNHGGTIVAHSGQGVVTFITTLP